MIFVGPNSSGSNVKFRGISSRRGAQSLSLNRFYQCTRASHRFATTTECFTSKLIGRLRLDQWIWIRFLVGSPEHARISNHSFPVLCCASNEHCTELVSSPVVSSNRYYRDFPIIKWWTDGLLQSNDFVMAPVSLFHNERMKNATKLF